MDRAAQARFNWPGSDQSLAGLRRSQRLVMPWLVSLGGPKNGWGEDGQLIITAESQYIVTNGIANIFNMGLMGFTSNRSCYTNGYTCYIVYQWGIPIYYMLVSLLVCQFVMVSYLFIVNSMGVSKHLKGLQRGFLREFTPWIGWTTVFPVWGTIHQCWKHLVFSPILLGFHGISHIYWELQWIILMIETASLSRLSQERPQHMPRFEASTTWKSLSPQLFSHQQRIHCGHPSRWKRPRQRAQLVAAADLFQSHQDIKKETNKLRGRW